MTVVAPNNQANHGPVLKCEGCERTFRRNVMPSHMLAYVVSLRMLLCEDCRHTYGRSWS